MKFSFEPMAECHGHAVTDIYNHYISNSMAAYPEEPVSHEFFNRFLQTTQGCPALVVAVDTWQVIGFGFLRPFHHASSIRRTAEVTYFILPEFTKQGIGTALLNRLVDQAVPMGIDNLVANISSKNEESIAFHRKNGFRECGRIEQAGRKCGQDFDIVWMQRRIAGL
ncbi:MAG: GNAT family N-acetyltransferase [Pirellulaceae bacterium]